MLSFETTPQLACHVGKIPLPPGETSQRDEICALTGVRIPAGKGNLVRWTVPDTFRDQYDIVDPTSPFVSRETFAILPRVFMQKYSQSVISPDGWFKFSENSAVAWHLLHPPTPPFAMVFGTAQMQHLLWRTPLSLSRELFFVRHGTRVLRIRHSRVLAALEITDACLAATNALYTKDKTKKPIRSAFVLLSRKINDDLNARIQPRVFDAAKAGVEPAVEFIRFLPTLTTGDLWALGRILASRSNELTPPSPITLELPKT